MTQAAHPSPSIKALVIGSQGQVAMALAQRLPAHGIDCVSTARPQIDLMDPQTVARVIAELRPTIVINPAAYTAVDRAEDEPGAAFAINAHAPGVIAQAAADVGAPIIHLSTDYVFDGTSRVPYRESDAPAPLGVYGRSKLEGERAVAAANPQHVILRTAWVCSADGANFVKTMLRLAKDRRELRVVDDQVGAPTFAIDIADAIAGIVHACVAQSARRELYGIFNVAGAGETTWCGFARAIMAGSRKRGGVGIPVNAIATADYPTRARRPAYSRLDTSKLAQVYDLSLPAWETSLETCLDMLVAPQPTIHAQLQDGT